MQLLDRGVIFCCGCTCHLNSHLIRDGCDSGIADSGTCFVLFATQSSHDHPGFDQKVSSHLAARRLACVFEVLVLRPSENQDLDQDQVLGDAEFGFEMLMSRKLCSFRNSKGPKVGIVLRICAVIFNVACSSSLSNKQVISLRFALDPKLGLTLNTNPNPSVEPSEPNHTTEGRELLFTTVTR